MKPSRRCRPGLAEFAGPLEGGRAASGPQPPIRSAAPIGELEVELERSRSAEAGRARKHLQAFGQMADRFPVGGALGRPPAGRQPVARRPAPAIAGLGEVVCDQFGLALDDLGEALFHRGRDARVQFLPAAAQQRP